jgi:MFS transporter, FSR family, fosmidomycin resistance protein
VWLTEAATACGILAMLVLPLAPALAVLPIIGIALNGTSSVLYGSVPELVDADKRTRAFSVFYTAAIGSGALAPTIYGVLGDVVGIPTAMIIAAAIVLLTLPLTLMLRPALRAVGAS